MLGRTIEPSTLGVHSLVSYEPLVGRERIERILIKADKIRDLHIVHVSSTFCGGVTEILTPLTLIMNTIGIETGWRMIQGTPALFNITKKLHNALQGSAIHLTSEEISLFEQIMFENAIRLPSQMSAIRPIVLQVTEVRDVARRFGLDVKLERPFQRRY